MEELEIEIEKEIDSEQLINILEEEIREIHPDYEQLTLTPSTEEQTKKGTFNKVTVLGDSNLVSENIKEGTSIFGVEGTAKTTNAKITSGQYLFYNGARFDYVNELLNLCENISSCERMFNNCYKLTELDLSSFDTSNVTNMSYMFNYCPNLIELDLSNFDTSKVTVMDNMFNNCSSLTELDLSSFDTSNVINMTRMFYSCSKLTELNLSSFDTSNVINMSNMFNYCPNLIELDLSNFVLDKVRFSSYMLYDLSGLVKLKSFKNLGKGYTEKRNNYNDYKLDLSRSTKLTHESLIDVITNGLYDLNLTYDVANGGTLYRQSLVLGSTNLAKLTAEEIAIATNKGWDVT